MPPVFENVIPDTPTLATATDEMHDFSTLKNRFDAYYDHVRKVTLELEERCQNYSFAATSGKANDYPGWSRRLFGSFAGRRKHSAAQ
jgi:hypothetical protein